MSGRILLVGDAEDITGQPLTVGTDGGFVTVGEQRFDLDAVEQLAQLLVRATWDAAQACQLGQIAAMGPDGEAARR